jgi:hypothetical protein
MAEKVIDRATMGRLSKALEFICGVQHPTTLALRTAAETGTPADVKKARTLFLKLKSTERMAAFSMLDDEN